MVFIVTKEDLFNTSIHSNIKTTVYTMHFCHVLFVHGENIRRYLCKGWSKKGSHYPVAARGGAVATG